MKRLSVILTFVFFGASAAPCFAQEAESKNSKNQIELTWVRQAVSEVVTQLQKYSDIARREYLKTTSERDLKFRCGRYWVDVYSKLITPDDREVGIWGVDVPSTVVPMRR